MSEQPPLDPGSAPAADPGEGTPLLSPEVVPGLGSPAEQPAPKPTVTPRGPARAIALFLLTLLTTTYWGFLQYQQFYLADLQDLIYNPLAEPMLVLAGLPYGLAVIAFLLAHEMGHYLACRYYGIRASLPYFIPIPPIPPILLPGTMGAVIRILSPLTSRRALFDVAIAGPLAGFAVALPILSAGLMQSRVVDNVDLGPTIWMGEPFIWGPLQALFAPPIGPDQALMAHPLAFVGWFALLVTAMNLLPIGQLDGGHLLYAITPRWHRAISLALVAFMVYAGIRYFSGWLVFALIVFFVLGTRHPRPLNFEQELGPRRMLLLLLALMIFATSFMLVPISIDLNL